MVKPVGPLDRNSDIKGGALSKNVKRETAPSSSLKDTVEISKKSAGETKKVSLASHSSKTPPVKSKEWTVMLYMAGSNNLDDLY